MNKQERAELEVICKLESMVIGGMMKNLEPLNNKEYKVTFSIQANTFFQKMVSGDMMKRGVRIKSDDYFKGLLFTDYFSRIIMDEGDFCGNLVEISSAMRKHDHDDDRVENSSYLPLESILFEAGIFTENMAKGSTYSALKWGEIEKRYSEEVIKEIGADGNKSPDLFYAALGKMVIDMAHDDLKKAFVSAKGRNDLQGIVFTSCIYEMLDDKKKKKDILDMMQDKGIMAGSLLAYDSLCEISTIEELERSLEGGMSDEYE